MITVIAESKLPQPMSIQQARETFLSTAPKYQGMPGLIRKYYFLAPDGTKARSAPNSSLNGTDPETSARRPWSTDSLQVMRPEQASVQSHHVELFTKDGLRHRH